VVLAVVVTDTEAIFGPLDVVSEGGFTEHVVAGAGTAQTSITGEEYPKKGVTLMSFTYCAVCPAVTVCDVKPRLDTAKSATKFNATGAEFDAT
jgi:hypothetical protein